MSADQIDKFLNKFISGSVVVYIDSSLRWNMETETVSLVGNQVSLSLSVREAGSVLRRACISSAVSVAA